MLFVQNIETSVLSESIKYVLTFVKKEDGVSVYLTGW